MKTFALRFLGILFPSLLSPYAEAALYDLIPPVASEKLACWAEHYPSYKEIVGFSVLGNFFLRDPASNDYIVLHPFKKAAKSYGKFSNVAEFEKKVLNEPGFVEYVLRPDHVKLVRDRVGPLKENEVYIPEPYPFIGGSDAPKTYSKGDVWVFMLIVAQMHGLCS